jgi:hypothetical protein
MTTNPKQHFDDLYAFIKTRGAGSGILQQLSFYSKGFTGWEGKKWEIVRSEALKIMESGIFDNGGLNSIYSHDPVLIENIDQFIYDLSELLSWYETKIAGWTPGYQYIFSDGVRDLEAFATAIRIFKGKRWARKFTTVLDKLKTLEKEIQAEPESPPGVSMPALKQDVAETFHRHIKVPNTKEIMATRSAELLNAFDISATPEGMREYFKNK